MRGDLVRKLAARCLTTGLAVLAFLVAGAHRRHRLGPGAGRRRAGRLGRGAADPAERRPRRRDDADRRRASWSVTPGGWTTGFDPALVATALVLLGLVLLVGPLRHAGNLEIRAANLPVRAWTPLVADRLGTRPAGAARRAWRSPPRLALPAWVALAASLLVGAGAGRGRAGPGPAAVPATAGGGPVGRALRRHQPEFLLYFSAPPGSEYQVTMWLPYLERIGRPFMVVLREPEFLAPIAAATDAPVVYCPTLRAMDEALVPSLRAAFYVNHGAKNSHCIRFTQLTHVQLHHGDSDKAPSANPVSGIFDRIFVAGQAAIDRYARAGVQIPADKFVVVGRPQVESIEVRPEPARGLAHPTVLYTPTWTGHHADADYCSLPVAESAAAPAAGARRDGDPAGPPVHHAEPGIGPPTGPA